MKFRDLRSPFKAHLFDGASRLCFIEGEQDDLAAGSGAGEGPSLRDELAAAFGADSGDASQHSDAPAPDTTAASPTPAPSATAQPRAPDGKFASPSSAPPKTEPNAQSVAAAPVQDQQAPAQTSGPPPSWSAAAKAEFDKLSPTIRQEVLKREQDIERGKAQWQQGAEQLNRLTAAIGPRADRWRMAGFSVDQGIQRLVAAEEALETNPVNAIAHLARQFGVDLRMFGQQAPQQQQLHPALQPLAQEVQALKNAMAQQSQSAAYAQHQKYQTQVNSFAADPKNKYFGNVAAEMSHLIRAGMASSIEDAYQKAAWANPDVRAALLKEQADAQAADARAKASQARHASGSVTGSPAPGQSPGGRGPAPTLRDELVQAFAQHAA